MSDWCALTGRLRSTSIGFDPTFSTFKTGEKNPSACFKAPSDCGKWCQRPYLDASAKSFLALISSAAAFSAWTPSWSPALPSRAPASTGAPPYRHLAWAYSHADIQAMVALFWQNTRSISIWYQKISYIFTSGFTHMFSHCKLCQTGG